MPARVFGTDAGSSSRMRGLNVSSHKTMSAVKRALLTRKRSHCVRLTSLLQATL